MRRLKAFWHRLRSGNTRLRRQMNLVYILALLIPLTIGGVALIGFARQRLNDYYFQLLEADNRRVKTLLTEVTTQAYDISNEVCYDNSIKEALTREYTNSSEFINAVNGYDYLERMNNSALEVANIYIYTDNPTVKDYKYFRSITDEVMEEEWYRRAMIYSNAFWVSIDAQTFTGTRNNLSLVRQIALPDSSYKAVVVIQVSDSYIRARLDTGTIVDAVAVDYAGIVYSSQSSLYGQSLPVEIDREQPYYRNSGIITVDGQRYFAFVSTINLHMTSSRMYVCTMDRTGFQDIRSITNTWILVLLLAILVPTVILTVFSGHFVSRVNRLRQEMHKASLRDYDLSSGLGGNDELTEAFADLKVMVQDIKEKDARMYEAQLNEQELLSKQQLMEFKMFAAQINPHYLYNTLETIRMKALTAGNRDVADSIKILGKTLHYVLENTGTAFTTLQKELAHVENYLSIQRLRFGDRINYRLDIQSDIDPAQYSILPLLLQPVVENAVVHGLETVAESGLVTIRVTRQDHILRIDVQDNGVGMDPQQLQQVTEALCAEQMPQSSIALYNIHQRIRLRYGLEYGVSVESTAGQGTRVCLELPADSLKTPV